MRRNFELALGAAGRLGGLPAGLLSPVAAAEHGPDQRATVLLVAHLAAVLLAAGGEARALFCIHRARVQRATAQPGAGAVTALSSSSTFAWGSPHRCYLILQFGHDFEPASRNRGSAAACIVARVATAVLSVDSVICSMSNHDCIAQTIFPLMHAVICTLDTQPAYVLQVLNHVCARGAHHHMRWRAGHMRATRQQWHRAAAVVQAAVRRWRSRRALAAALAAIHCGVLAVVALQAAWRARPARRAFLLLQSATLTAQVLAGFCPAIFFDVQGCSDSRIILRHLTNAWLTRWPLVDVPYPGAPKRMQQHEHCNLGPVSEPGRAVQATWRGAATRRQLHQDRVVRPLLDLALLRCHQLKQARCTCWPTQSTTQFSRNSQHVY